MLTASLVIYLRLAVHKDAATRLPIHGMQIENYYVILR